MRSAFLRVFYLFIFAALPVGAVTIVPTYDSTITTAPNAQAIEDCIASAAAVYQQLFSDKITVSIFIALHRRTRPA